MQRLTSLLRNITASAVREHLRSAIEANGRSPQLTKSEVELVRFIWQASLDWGRFLAERPAA